MSRIKQVFQQLKTTNTKALIPYVTAADPNPEMTVDLLYAMVDAGANLLELGVPFSDPMADGPVIQKASERSLTHGTSLLDVFSMVSTFREKDQQTPIILMGYLNPIEVMGYKSFARQASKAGVDAVLIVDFPPEESQEFLAILAEYQLDSIFLLSPTTTDERIKLICSQANGFVYYVAVKGVTGSATLDTTEVSQRIKLIKSITDLPVGVGFGIKDASTAKIVGQSADAVIVGSALVNIIAKGALDNEPKQSMINKITELLSSMRTALDSK
ncbi:MAG: tryptophan synthase subunit alpha [Pseudomonadota bacterium]